MGRKHPPDCKHCEAVRRPKPPQWFEKMRGRKHPPDCKHCAAVRTTGAGAYTVVHRKMRASLPKVCAMKDETCLGRLEVALRHEAVIAGHNGIGSAFSIRAEDYFRLCKSHHTRYDKH